MIQLTNVSMDYSLEGERIPVLQDIGFDIGSGESVAIVGPSGSGKSTLLLLLAGLESPSSGSIRLLGQSLEKLAQDEIADMRCNKIGIVFQSFHLIPSLDALSNVALPLQIQRVSNARIRAQDMLERVGLGHRCRHYPRQLSGGEQQRVAIARALVHQPAMLLADEPTGNLDSRTGHVVSDLLFDLHKESGTTLVMVTHDSQMARRCQRALILEEGRVEAGVPGEF